MTRQTGWHFSFELSEEDDRNFGKISTKVVKSYLDMRILRLVPTGAFLLIMGAIYFAYTRQWLPISAIFVAEAAFVICFAAFLAAILMAIPGCRSRMFAEAPVANRSFDCRFEEDEIVVKQGLRQIRMPWRAIWRVQDTPSMVVM